MASLSCFLSKFLKFCDDMTVNLAVRVEEKNLSHRLCLSHGRFLFSVVLNLELVWGSGRVTKEYMTKDEENLLQKIEVLENEIF